MDIFSKALENDVAYLQSNIVSLNQKDPKGKTLLHYAVLGSSNDVIDFLLSQDIDCNIKDNNGETPIFDAARKAKLNIAKKLISKYAKVDIQNNRNETPLHLACHNGNLDMVKLLIEEKANIYAKTNDDKLPIHYAILSGNLNCCKYIIEDKNLKVTTVDGNMNTLLHYATRTTNLSLIKYLLDERCNPNALNDQFETPLFNAVKYGTNDTVLELLKSGSFIEIINRRYETPLIIAKLYENKSILSLLEEWALTSEYQSSLSKFSLILSVLNRDVNHTKLLIHNGAVLRKDRLRLSALDYATMYKFTVLVTLLKPLKFDN